MERLWTARAVGLHTSLKDVGDKNDNRGLKCYAYKEAAIWSKLADDAAVQFSSAKIKLKAEDGNSS